MTDASPAEWYFEPFLFQNSVQVTIWLAPPKWLRNIKIWWLCRPWEMFSFSFMFIKPLSQVLLCVLVHYHADTWQGTMFPPLGAHGFTEWFGSPWQWPMKHSREISAQTITNPPVWCYASLGFLHTITLTNVGKTVKVNSSVNNTCFTLSTA